MVVAAIALPAERQLHCGRKILKLADAFSDHPEGSRHAGITHVVLYVFDREF
jgi:hypothetical protein